MTRAERELLIQRYMSGEMSSVEESDFFIQVALDKELRQDLKAQRTIESAFRKDRDSEPSQHTALRSRVAAVLAASSVSAPGNTPTDAPANAPASPAPSSPVPTGAAGASAARWFAKPLGWLAASTAAVIVTVGLIIVMPGTRTAGTSSSTGSEPRIERSAPASPALTSPAASTTRETPADATPTATPGIAPSGRKEEPPANESNKYPPASLSSDGVRLGSAAQAPRRDSHITSRDGAERVRESSNAAQSRTDASSTRSGVSSDLNALGKSDGGTINQTRPRRSGKDSIAVGARVQLRRPTRK